MFPAAASHIIRRRPVAGWVGARDDQADAVSQGLLHHLVPVVLKLLSHEVAADVNIV